jgi:hypothetical protein
MHRPGEVAASTAVAAAFTAPVFAVAEFIGPAFAAVAFMPQAFAAEACALRRSAEAQG